MDLRILIFSIAVGTNYSIEFISIETYVPQFIGRNKTFQAVCYVGLIFPREMISLSFYE